jgi:hypothetical protein
MYWEVQNSGIWLKYMLTSITVVNIPVQQQNSTRQQNLPYITTTSITKVLGENCGGGGGERSESVRERERHKIFYSETVVLK